MTTILENDSGKLSVSEAANERRLLTVVPRDVKTFVMQQQCETTYPLDLIEMIFELDGVGSICDTIARDEDPNYVQRMLANDLFAYFDSEDFAEKRILDFGCGRGASTAILGRMFPRAEITGVELVPAAVAIARKISEHHSLTNVKFYESPSGTELPPETTDYDFVIMSAVYEHLLPDERRPVMRQLWQSVRSNGFLFINQTPNQLFPVELHTTMLPFINYVPDRAAFWMARRFSNRIEPDESAEQLLRKGIRGATVGEILGHLNIDGFRASLLEPCKNGLKDRIDLFYENTNSDNLRLVKQVARIGIKAINLISGVAIIPDLSLAIRKLPLTK